MDFVIFRLFIRVSLFVIALIACIIYLIKKRKLVYSIFFDNDIVNITPHTLRHTFCTRLAQKNMNPKNLQYIMEHSNITITLNLYAHASEVGANKEMRSMIA